MSGRCRASHELHSVWAGALGSLQVSPPGLEQGGRGGADVSGPSRSGLEHWENLAEIRFIISSGFQLSEEARSATEHSEVNLPG